MSALPVNYEHLTQPERAKVRAQYVERQGGKCSHCAYDLNGDPSPEIARKAINWQRFPPKFLKWPIHLHHSHKTGMTIGAVHARCNAVLWQYHGE